MFNAIAHRYDLLNHLLSAGIDIYWRRRALSLVRHEAPRRLLDVATGTGDLAIAARRLGPERIVAADVALEMVRLGVPKAAAGGLPIHWLGGDAERLPFADGAFDLVTAAFGVRNFGDIPAGLAEARRVLRPGGLFFVVVPDYVKERTFFWDVDYTHNFVTTERRVRQLLFDAGFETEATVASIGAATGLARDLLAAASVLPNLPGTDTLARRAGAGEFLFRVRKNFFATLEFVARKPGARKG